MYNVSFRVSDAKLADTLTRLRDVAPSWEISHIPEASQSMASPAQATATKTVKVRRHRRTYSRRNGGLTDSDKVVSLIQQIGQAPFKSQDLIANAHKAGIPTPSVYRALRVECQAGTLVRLEPGKYQRTAKSFAKDVVKSLSA